MSNQSLVTAIDHCSVIVDDTQKALEFYCGILGLERDDSRPEMSYPGAWLNIGSGQGRGQIHLLELPNPDPVNGRPAHGGRDRHVALRVSDIDLIARSLEQNGFEFSMSKSGRKALFCRDHDGNAVELVQK
jgi:glyoxylase I family protein